MKASIGLTDKNSQQVAIILNTLLADQSVLYSKTRSYHWNYEGDNFMEIHKFYEGQYEELQDMIDAVAERIRYIGHYAEGRLKEYLKLTQLTEPSGTTVQKEQINNLLFDHEAIIRWVRKQIDVTDEKLKDAGTTDFLTGMMEKHEKMAWMLRAYLK